MFELTLLFFAVFVLNLLPAFAPPTWMALGLFGFNFPQFAPLLVALVAACSATAGRVALAGMAQQVARSRWMRPAALDNLQAVAELLARRRQASALMFLLFAFSPLPSNVLFLAYGLTGAPLRWLALPFFVGRCASYSVAVMGGAYAAAHLQTHWSGAASGLYFVLTQSALLALVWLFTRINWRQALSQGWLRRL